MFEPVSAKVSFPQLEEKILAFWKKKRIFEKSVDRRPETDLYSFYDGPPFVTGRPHYGTLLSSIAKDVVPRYFAMKGKRVRRVWGWDCHGLPVEEKTEKKLGLKNRRDIERIGVEKFIDECRQYVSETSAEWNWYIDRIGRWVDMDNAYRTMDLSFMESVIWAFKKVYDQGLIYQGLKTLLYCTRCGTPVSKFEIAMDDSYAMMADPAVTVKFKLKEGKLKNAFVLAWTTTPWTLPSNRALVVDENEDYLLVRTKSGKEGLVLAEKRLEAALKGKEFEVQDRFRGKELLGLAYEPLYTFFKANRKDFKVYSYPGMVNMDEGTGVVHSAPGFGEIDTEMGREAGLTLMFGVDDEGKFVKEVKDWAGVYVKDADEKIIEDLRKKGLLFKKETITHRYPFCYRCETPLIYKAVKAWFLDIQRIKKKMLDLNQRISWVPAHFKNGRFKYTLEEAPDWCVSRTRYWATVMPIWRCGKCQTLKVAGSVKEIEENSVEKVKITDLHRTGVDPIKFSCPRCGGEMGRVPEVLDVWFESGSMPYGERHYPFENEAVFEKGFPADYIAEYVAQVRAWFYYLHVLSTALFQSHSFKNVVVTGVIAGTDGRKMSKSYRNFPDPKKILTEYGGDALRLYLMGSVIMLGRDMNMTQGEEIKDQVKTVLLPLWNSYRFLVTFARLHSWKPNQGLGKPKNVLDRWIISRLNQFHRDFSQFMDRYQIPQATRLIRGFVDDLSKWFIRQSRNRFNRGEKEALETLYHVLVELTKIAAPMIPFVSEKIFRNLTGEESVHLQDWPQAGEVNDQLLADMVRVRRISELGHADRKQAKIKVRQPLACLRYHLGQRLDQELEELVGEELNVKTVEWVKSEAGEPTIDLDLKLTPRLRAEGEARELVREIQDLRKKKGCRRDQKVTVVAPAWPPEFEDFVKERTGAVVIKKGKTLAIE